VFLLLFVSMMGACLRLGVGELDGCVCLPITRLLEHTHTHTGPKQDATDVSAGEVVSGMEESKVGEVSKQERSSGGAKRAAAAADRRKQVCGCGCRCEL